jgi:hypothetical protein
MIGRILEKITTLLGIAQIQAAIIAGIVSLVVARLTTSRDRRARRLERSQRLLRDTYYPIQTFLLTDSLYNYVAHNKPALEQNRRNFSKDVSSLIDRALKEYVKWPTVPMGLPTGHGENDDDLVKAKVSKDKLAAIEHEIKPRLDAEIERHEAIVEKEAG